MSTLPESFHVLIIEDFLMDILFIEKALEKSARRSFFVYKAANLEEAEKSLKVNRINVIVLDLGLPGSSKTETLLWMLRQQHPVVVVTGDEDDATVGEAFRHGAQDYLVKGNFSGREVVRCIVYAVERAMIRKELLFFKNNVERIVQDRVKERLKGT